MMLMKLLVAYIKTVKVTTCMVIYSNFSLNIEQIEIKIIGNTHIIAYSIMMNFITR